VLEYRGDEVGGGVMEWGWEGEEVFRGVSVRGLRCGSLNGHRGW